MSNHEQQCNIIIQKWYKYLDKMNCPVFHHKGTKTQRKGQFLNSGAVSCKPI